MIIDSHQHFWKYNPIRDSWIDDTMQIIRRDFLPKDLAPIFIKNKIDGCISVQADQSETETEFLLNLAKNNAFIKGVVGWVDLCSSTVEERLIHYTKNKLFKGVRHILQAEDTAFFKNLRFLHGISQLATFNLTYDILVYHHQLKDVIALVKKFPKQKFVIDHIAKPDISAQNIANWSNGITELSTFENVYIKLSGMVTEADWNNWNEKDFKEYLDVIFNTFSMNKIMYGSDWPVCLLAAKYEEQLAIITQYIQILSAKERALILGENARIFYNL